jgi:hypothetical protein
MRIRQFVRRYTLAISCLLLLLRAATGSADNSTATTEVFCDVGRDEAAKCVLVWDISTAPLSTYQVQVLSRDQLAWVDVDKGLARSEVGRIDVRPGNLYRVMVCNDISIEPRCESSAASWATYIRPVDELPDEMLIADTDGSIMAVTIAKSTSRYTQLSQYNVYLLTDLINQVVMIDPGLLPVMHPPTEFPDRQPTLDHQVRHSIHSVYESTRHRPR